MHDDRWTCRGVPWIKPLQLAARRLLRRDHSRPHQASEQGPRARAPRAGALFQCLLCLLWSLCSRRRRRRFLWPRRWFSETTASDVLLFLGLEEIKFLSLLALIEIYLLGEYLEAACMKLWMLTCDLILWEKICNYVGQIRCLACICLW